MRKQWKLAGVAGLGLLLLGGCATGKNYQADMDTMNARIADLQGQLAAKDNEIAALRQQLGQANRSLDDAMKAKKNLHQKLDRVSGSSGASAAAEYK